MDRRNFLKAPTLTAGATLLPSPIQVHGVTKVPARRAPRIGEHNDEVLKELGFTSDEISGLRATGAAPQAALAAVPVHAPGKPV